MTVETPSLPAKNISVSLIRNWPITLFSAGLFPLLIFLGMWQIQRAEEKDLIRIEVDSRLSAQPKMPEFIDYFKRYTPVKLIGNYTEEYYFLDNRTRHGQAGYEILQLFTSKNKRWLINRGWIALPSSRNLIPKITIPQGARTILGFFYPVNEETLPDAYKTEIQNRIQRLDKSFTSRLVLSEPEWSVRLSADSDTALITEWNLMNMGAERHRAYAVQWFTMAAALIILWIFSATNFIQLNRKNKYK